MKDSALITQDSALSAPDSGLQTSDSGLDTSLIEHLESQAATRIRACYQCQKCASGCPISFATDWLPSQIIRLVLLGKAREVLSSRAIWLCLTCSACTARCPMGIDLAQVMDALRRRAVAEGAAPAATAEAVFNDAFLKSVRRHGRVYEMGMMTAYKMRSRRFLRDVEKFPMMVAKGKIALLPPRGADKDAAREVFEKVGKK